MKQPISQLNPFLISKFQFISIIVSVVLTVIIIGGGIFWWVNQKQRALNDKIISLEKQIDQLKYISVTSTQNVIPPTQNYKADGAKIYQNTTLGFRLILPSESWYIDPGSEPHDPHFYLNEACAQMDRPDCPAIEVQNNDEEFEQGLDIIFNNLKAEGLNPMKLTHLIPGAIVIKSDAPGGAESWSWQYDVFFSAEKKKFTIFTNDTSLEKSVLPTFKLLK